MSNCKSREGRSVWPFSHFSEANSCEKKSVSLVPYLIRDLESRGIFSAFPHIAKGGVPIRTFTEGASGECFLQKSSAFFEEA